MINYPDSRSKDGYIEYIWAHFYQDLAQSFEPDQTKALANAIIDNLSKLFDEAIDKEKILKELKDILETESFTPQEKLDLSCIYGDFCYYKTSSKDSAVRAIAAFNASNPHKVIEFPKKNEKDFLELQKAIFEKCVQEIIEETEKSLKTRKRKSDDSDDKEDLLESNPKSALPSSCASKAEAEGLIKKEKGVGSL